MKRTNLQSNGNSCDGIDTGNNSPLMSNGKPENGICPDSTKLNGNDASTDLVGSSSPSIRSNGDLNIDVPSNCDVSDGVTTPIHLSSSTTLSLQEAQQQPPTTTIHGVQVSQLFLPA